MQQFYIQVEAGPERRPDCLLEVALPEGAGPGIQLESEGKATPAQATSDGKLLFVADALEAGESRRYTARSDGGHQETTNGVELREQSGLVAITLNGVPFTAYFHGADVPRPYFFPLMAASRVSVTRSWPMEEGPPNEDKDHPHHRGLWVAHGDVNGFDNWHAGAATRHQGFAFIRSGPVRGDLEARGEWVANDGQRLLTERRRASVWSLPDGCRMIDIDLELSPVDGPVIFGDTKEGGICSVRVASSMTGTRTGHIETAAGRRGEKESWGSRAAWCDYSGTVEGQHVGVAILDHPENFRHPTYWHVRDYGLMTANPFGIATFTGDPAQDGAYTLPAAQSLRFRHRVVVHSGNASDSAIAGHYRNWIEPPSVSLE